MLAAATACCVAIANQGMRDCCKYTYNLWLCILPNVHNAY